MGELVVIAFILFVTFIIGVGRMGMQKKVNIKHTTSGIVKGGYYGFSWTYLIFGWMVPIFRGEIGIGALHLLFTLITLGIFQLIMPFLYNQQYSTRLLTSGWELADTERNNRAARIMFDIDIGDD